MILVTVGTEQFPFNRLMLWIKVLLERELIDEKIVVQYGSCSILPLGIESFSKLPPPQFQEIVQKARLVIGHCGEGTVLLLTQIFKPYILVPRTCLYGEHLDDHQIELGVALEQKNIPIAWSPGDLVRFIASPRYVPIPRFKSEFVCKDLKKRFS
ncbi:Glycosyltransferase 28 domain protein [Gloeothece citriformis PCC 7424]|uniref:Glycosyltransferase 28 domain protein n=1 Tax=Gloeothece citriformis (strain PCC 7424) TaxID=65393 RepID=B7KAG5_GLOC7|nr:glycosyltransferase [Gloeothece citriformis]ACK72939.1 Glycosyltransferase 28 domain protein [Gloeothece citriformis PCC 7424]